MITPDIIIYEKTMSRATETNSPEINTLLTALKSLDSIICITKWNDEDKNKQQRDYLLKPIEIINTVALYKLNVHSKSTIQAAIGRILPADDPLAALLKAVVTHSSTASMLTLTTLLKLLCTLNPINEWADGIAIKLKNLYFHCVLTVINAALTNDLPEPHKLLLSAAIEMTLPDDAFRMMATSILTDGEQADALVIPQTLDKLSLSLETVRLPTQPPKLHHAINISLFSFKALFLARQKIQLEHLYNDVTKLLAEDPVAFVSDMTKFNALLEAYNESLHSLENSITTNLYPLAEKYNEFFKLVQASKPLAREPSPYSISYHPLNLINTEAQTELVTLNGNLDSLAALFTTANDHGFTACIPEAIETIEMAFAQTIENTTWALGSWVTLLEEQLESFFDKVRQEKKRDNRYTIACTASESIDLSAISKLTETWLAERRDNKGDKLARTKRAYEKITLDKLVLTFHEFVALEIPPMLVSAFNKLPLPALVNRLARDAEAPQVTTHMPPPSGDAGLFSASDDRKRKPVPVRDAEAGQVTTHMQPPCGGAGRF